MDMGDTREFCLARRQAERKAFVKVLKAMPQARLDYKPEPKSRTAAELAWVIATEEAALLDCLEKGAIEWSAAPAPGTVDEIVRFYEKSAQMVDEKLAALDDAAWARPAKFMAGGKSVWEDTVGNFMWGFLFDAIHHRGQLSTYLRPMGGKVPAIYGPSADENS
jgi:uncharacterized damage-inducible protein DinB